MNKTFSLAVTALALTAGLQTAEAQGRRRGGQGRAPDTLRQGQAAPDFELKLLDKDGKTSDETVKLSSFEGKKPVVLIFGSYT